MVGVVAMVARRVINVILGVGVVRVVGLVLAAASTMLARWVCWLAPCLKTQRVAEGMAAMAVGAGTGLMTSFGHRAVAVEMPAMAAAFTTWEP